METRTSKASMQENQITTSSISIGYRLGTDIKRAMCLLACLTMALWGQPQAGLAQEDDKAQTKDEAQNKSEAKTETTSESGDAGKDKAPASEKKGPIAPEAIKHYNAGLELHKAGWLLKAVGEYKLALAADDRLEQAYSNLGLIYISQKNFSQAQDAFAKALKLRPNRPTSLNGMASVLFARNQVKPAIELWQKTISIDPKFASAYFNMGMALESDKRADEAKDSYIKAIELDPALAEAYFRVGSIFNKEKHPAQALVLLNQAVELQPESEFARDARKQISALEGQLARDIPPKPKAKTKDDEKAAMVNQSPSKAANKHEIEVAKQHAIQEKMEDKQKELEDKEKERLHPTPKPENDFFGLRKYVKRKPELVRKSDQKVKMFIKQPQAEDSKSEAEDDLKAKP